MSIADRPMKFPSIPPVLEAGEKGAFFQAVQETLEVGLNRAGNPLDAFVKVRDLVSLGVASYDPFAGGGRPIGDGTPRPGGEGYNPFLQPPRPGTNPRPTTFTNIRTVSVWNGIRVSWDFPVAAPGSGLEYAGIDVWAARQIGPDVPAFSQGAFVGQVRGATNFFFHDLGPDGFGQVWWYWLRWVYITSAQFPTPFSEYTPSSAGRGVRGASAQSPTQLTAALVNQIRSSQLNTELADAIAGGNFVTDEVNVSISQRILAGNASLNSAIAQLAALRRDAQGVLSGSFSVRIDLDAGSGRRFVTGFGFSARSGPGDLNPLLPGDQNQDSEFIIRSHRFGIVQPGQNPGDEVYPFIVGQIIEPDWDGNGDPPLVSLVGVNGRLVVNGTLHASAIQAGTIGAREINAQQIATRILQAENIITGSLATGSAESGNWRVYIGGGNDQFPFWYGFGPVGGSQGVFELDRLGNVRLAGNLTVTGEGRFSLDRGATGARVEIGGTSGFLIWAGTGQTNEQNGTFFVRDDGTPFVRGQALTLPVSGGDSDTATINVVPPVGASTAKIMVIATGVINSNLGQQLKTIAMSMFEGGTEVDRVAVSTTNAVESITSMKLFDRPLGNFTIQLRAFTGTGAGGGTPTQATFFFTRILMLQVSSVAAS